jgi:hypothetical protein
MTRLTSIRQEQQAHADRFEVDLARHPHRVVPGPPDDAEREDGVNRSRPAQVVQEQMRDLGDGEDEDQVVEELERDDPLPLLDDGPWPVALGRGCHGASLASASHADPRDAA